MGYTLEDLTYLMDRLRDPEDGCPWDLEQSFATIVPHTLEEAYEVADTIEREDWGHLEDELGDLLFQVIFYSRLAKEQSLFTLDSVIDQLVTKLIRRHPHVFPDGTLNSRKGDQAIKVQGVNEQWEQIKQTERDAKQRSGVLDEIPRALPALTRAAKLTKRASSVGFDWDSALGVIDKIEEEIGELRQAIEAGRQEEIEAELGDLIFAQVNLARKLGVNPEQAVRLTNAKFERRFRYIEQQVNESGRAWQDFTLEQLDLWWEAAKAQEV